MIVTSSNSVLDTSLAGNISNENYHVDLPSKKKKRKADGGVNLVEPSTKKKKRKHTSESLPVDRNQLNAPQEAPTSSTSRKKGKKRRESNTVAVTVPIPETVAETDENAQASTAAFLSAIVAAATGSLDANSTMQSQYVQEHQQFMPPFSVQYPYQPLTYPQNPVEPAAPVPMPLSDMSFGSNEDVLRALHELDISKIANVLKTLGDAAAAANLPTFGMQQTFSPPPGPMPPPPTLPVHHNSAGHSSTSTTPNSRESNTRGHRRTLDMSARPPDQNTNPDHAYLLANKWLNANKLAELVKAQGLVYKKGKFSAIEEQQIKSAIDAYRTNKELNEQQMQEIIFPKNEKNKETAFWSEITSAVPLRPIIAVYHHVRRTHHPIKQQGRWSLEEDGLLKQAVTDLGQQWEKISECVGRRSADCRDRYRNHIINREIRVTGPWSKEEEDQLTRIVTQMTVEQGKDIDNDVFWGRVSELMGGRRGRQQCRIKWTDALSKTIKNEGQKPRWSQQDAFILVHKVDSLNVRDDTEIDWKTLPDPSWNLWSAHTLQRRWLTMKRGIKGYEDMTHQEIMDILRVKKAHLPETTLRKRKKVTSAAAITDADLQRDFSGVETSVEGSPG